MIVVDTSALLAILLKEPDRDACIDVLEAESEVAISAGTLTEALIVAGSRGIETELRMLVRRLAFNVLPVTEAVAKRVALAYARWGRGPSAASLNFGDCFAYEAAASTARKVAHPFSRVTPLMPVWGSFEVVVVGPGSG